MQNLRLNFDLLGKSEQNAAVTQALKVEQNKKGKPQECVDSFSIQLFFNVYNRKTGLSVSFVLKKVFYFDLFLP